MEARPFLADVRSSLYQQVWLGALRVPSVCRLGYPSLDLLVFEVQHGASAALAAAPADTKQREAGAFGPHRRQTSRGDKKREEERKKKRRTTTEQHR